MSAEPRSNFLRTQIQADLEAARVDALVTRFPPEPNGYLHIGHAKSITVNFGLAEQFGGQCHLRFDDTNPEKESQEFIDSIQEDVRWLGYQWAGEVRYASSYFEQLYQWALYLVGEGLAYVCDLSAEDAREYRGTLTDPGRDSPFRDRSVDENRDLFERMRRGEFADGERVLRAKIDMASSNMNLRDPILYRIRHTTHHQTGSEWPIYPTYDFAHGQEDAIEGITHSICTLEFEDHRPLYNWFIVNLPVPHQPRQIEFARLNTSYTITSKRKLKQLVDEKHVDGWDDPRMSTLSAFRRRGYTPAAIREASLRDPDTPFREGGVADFVEVTRSEPEKSLLRPLSKSGGRNNSGKITTRHKGGGHKRAYRLIDFKRADKDGVPANVESITRELKDFVKRMLLPYKYPRIIEYLDELPKTGTGKLDRQALKSKVSDEYATLL